MCFFLNKKVHLLVGELYIYQNARCNNKNCLLVHLQTKNTLNVFYMATQTFSLSFFIIYAIKLYLIHDLSPFCTFTT